MNKKDFIKMKDNESFWIYSSRLYRHKIELGLDNAQIYEIIKKETNTQLKESTVRCNCKSINFGREEGIREYAKSDNEIFKDLEESKLELEKLKMQYQDQKREYKAFLKMDSKFEHLQSEIIKNIETLNKTHALYRLKPYKKNVDFDYKEACLILSDIHLGMVIDDGFNKYDIEVAKERFNYLKDKVIEYCTLNNVSVLHIELLGDFCNGYLHISNRVDNEEDVISQTIDVSEMLSNFIYELSEKINAIEIYSTIGNHGRTSANIKDSISVENFERIIPWYLETRLKDCGNVEVVQTKNKDDIIVYDIINETIFACHGHKDRLATIVNDLSLFLKKFPSEIHCGHYHSHKTELSGDVELIVNGSFCGTDDFAKSIRRNTKPSQTLIIYNEKGQECLYNIKL